MASLRSSHPLTLMKVLKPERRNRNFILARSKIAFARPWSWFASMPIMLSLLRMRRSTWTTSSCLDSAAGCAERSDVRGRKRCERLQRAKGVAKKDVVHDVGAMSGTYSQHSLTFVNLNSLRNLRHNNSQQRNPPKHLKHRKHQAGGRELNADGAVADGSHGVGG